MSWDLLPADEQLFERELSSFVPPQVFDAHAHLYDVTHCRTQPPPLLADGPATAGWLAYRDHIRQILPARSVTGLFFPFPASDLDITAANAFLRDQMQIAAD